jgi:hypothetical protein
VPSPYAPGRSGPASEPGLTALCAVIVWLLQAQPRGSVSGSSGHKTTARAAAARIADGVLMGAHECGVGADVGYCWPSAVSFSAVALAW